MATSSPSPTSPLAVSPTSAVTPPPQPSTPAPDPPTVTNSNPPNSSIPLTPPPTQATSPPLASPPPLDTPSPPPPTDPSTPPAPATSPPPPTATPSSSPPPPIDAPPPSTPASPPIITVSPPPPTPVNTPLTSPPPPAIPPPSTGTPSGPSPPSDPPSSPPPPATNPKSSPPSTLHPPYSSPPPPHSKTQQPPPPGPQATSPPPPSTKSVHRPTSAPPSPESSPPPPSPGPPNASPSKNSSSPSSPISLNVPLLSPPPPLSPTPGSHIPSSAPNPFSGNSTASPPRKGGVSEGGVVAIGVVVGIVMLGLIGMVVLYISKRRQRTSNGGYVVPSPYGSSPRSDSNLLIKTQGSTPFGRSGSGSGTLSPHSLGGFGQSRSWFTYQELYEATNGFALGSLLGEGGFGVVYKGVLTNGREVAVKQLKTGGGEGEREFRSEVETISRIHHRHLVSLVGYCIYENQRLLVYEYVPNQTLHYHLHGEDRPVMDWATRIKIAKGAARGIAYLHEDCHPRIIHRDIKSSNILIDNRFEARVSDFGTARLALDADTHISTRVMGTFGYMAPEYATSGKLTDKSDVYSFGVVLLELITGRKPVDESQPIGDESLVEWARPLLSHVLETGQVEGLVDPRLEKNYVESELILMIEAAAACVRHMATKRPQMGQIVRAFDGLSPSDLSNGMRVGQSEIYDSAQQSVDIRWFRRMAFGSHGYSTDYFSEATRNTGHSNPTQIDQGAGFSAQQGRNDPSQQGAGISTQQSRNDPSLQQSQNIYFSSQRTQSLAFSGQWSQNPSVFRQSSQNPISRQQSSQNPTLSGQSSQNLDSSSRQSESS